MDLQCIEARSKMIPELLRTSHTSEIELRKSFVDTIKRDGHVSSIPFHSTRDSTPKMSLSRLSHSLKHVRAQRQ